MLKYTHVRFELLTDIDMIVFIERGICGGLSQCSNRYAQANNKYMHSFDPSSYLMYYEVNNLYGWACQPLPYAEFQWFEDAANFDVRSLRIHPLVIFSRSISSIHSIYTTDTLIYLSAQHAINRPASEDKLLATLYDKQRYVIHYRNLQQCIRHGLRVIKIHRVL